MISAPNPDQINATRYAQAADIGYGEVNPDISVHSLAIAGSLMLTRHVLVTTDAGKGIDLVLDDTQTKLLYLGINNPVLRLRNENDKESSDIIAQSVQELRTFVSEHGAKGIVLANVDPLLREDPSELSTEFRARQDMLSLLAHIVKNPSADKNMPQLCIGSNLLKPESDNLSGQAKTLVRPFIDSVDPTEMRQYSFVGEMKVGDSSVGRFALGAASTPENTVSGDKRSNELGFREVFDRRSHVLRPSIIARIAATVLPGANF